MVRNLIILAMFFVLNSAFALQVKSIKDNQTAFFKISAKELTRIFVKDDRIQSTRGLDGAYLLTKDEVQGAIFIKPTAYYQKTPFNLFITTESSHTYNLFLSPIDIPAQTIELRPLSPVKAVAERWEKNSNYSETLISLVTTMANGSKPDGYAMVDVETKPKKLRSGLTMQLMIQYQGSLLKGEVWKLKNAYCRTLRIHPQDFYVEDVRAIALKDEVIHNCDVTYLYRVVGI